MSDLSPEAAVDILRMAIVVAFLFVVLRYGLIPMLTGYMPEFADFITIAVYLFVIAVLLDMVRGALQ